MHMGRYASLILVLLTVASSAVAVAETQPERDYGSGSVHRYFEWRNSEGEGRATGLYLVDFVPTGMVSRVLAEDPAGRQVRITVSLDPRRGVQICELLDDATGWRARLELDNGLRADTLGAFFAADVARSAARQPVVYRVSFTADGTRPVVVDLELDVVEPETLHAAVTEAVSAAGAARQLAPRLPPELAETVLFLDSSMSPQPLQAHTEGDNFAHGLRGVVEVLADILHTAPPEGLEVERYATPWPMTVGPMKRGTSSSDPAVLEFVSRFRSVENADPLSDRRAAEVFAAPLPPT